MSETDLSSYGELADILENLPLILREARRARRATLQQVVEQTGVSIATLIRLERGGNRTADGEAPDPRRSGIALANAVTILRWLDGVNQKAEPE